MPEIRIDLEHLYKGTAKLADLDTYMARAQESAGRGNLIVLTGRAPVWLYLKIAHALHGSARKLVYRDGQGNEVVVFDHDPH